MRVIPFSSCPSAPVEVGRVGPGFMRVNELDLDLPGRVGPASHLGPAANGIIGSPSWSSSVELILVLCIRESWHADQLGCHPGPYPGL